MTMRYAALSFLLLFTPLHAENLLGFDTAELITVQTFKCMQNYVNFDFFVASLMNASTGSVDSVGLENIRRSREAGHTDIQAYVTPCASSNCPSAHQQVANVFGTLRQRKLTLSKVWVDVGGAEWPCDVTKNRKFIWALARSIAAYGTPVGIRTSAGRWLTVVGEWSDLSAYYPLWYTLLDGGQQTWNFPGFEPFGGWHEFDVCQYAYGDLFAYTCNMPHVWGRDSSLGAFTTTKTTSTTDPTTTITTSTSTSPSTLATTTTTTTTMKPETTPITTTTTTITTTSLKPTTTSTTTTTTELTATTKKCRLWIFC
ncbi:Protein LYS-5 [Aphelenchoides avenae]|nr:Protein LYS-5 [Aphelenchus avenae]